MANPVAFVGVEKDQLIRFGHSLIFAEVSHVDAAIGKNQLRGRRALLRALRAANALAGRVPDRHSGSFEESLNVKFRHAFGFRQQQPVSRYLESVPKSVEQFAGESIE